jgi:hypothetical protein
MTIKAYFCSVMVGLDPTIQKNIIVPGFQLSLE